jgi:hypothetical protein
MQEYPNDPDAWSFWRASAPTNVIELDCAKVDADGISGACPLLIRPVSTTKCQKAKKVWTLAVNGVVVLTIENTC